MKRSWQLSVYCRKNSTCMIILYRYHQWPERWLVHVTRATVIGDSVTLYVLQVSQFWVTVLGGILLKILPPLNSDALKQYLYSSELNLTSSSIAMLYHVEIKGEVYYSRSYQRVTKRNSYTILYMVMISDAGLLYTCMIKYGQEHFGTSTHVPITPVHKVSIQLKSVLLTVLYKWINLFNVRHAVML